MNKADLIEEVAYTTGVPRSVVKIALNAAFGIMRDELFAGSSVLWSGFGKFSVIRKAARKGRDPRSGVEIDLPAGEYIKFHPARKLRYKMR